MSSSWHITYEPWFIRCIPGIYHPRSRSSEVCSFDKALASLGVYQNCKLPLTSISGGIFVEYTYKLWLKFYILHIDSAAVDATRRGSLRLTPTIAQSSGLTPTICVGCCSMQCNCAEGLHFSAFRFSHTEQLSSNSDRSICESQWLCTFLS